MTETRPVTILIGEDDPDDRKILKKTFGSRKRNIHLIFTEDGEEVLDYVRRRGIYSHPQASPKPDLVMLDLHLPRRNGKEVLREIRETKGIKSLPVIILTGSKSDEDMMESFDLGVHSYFQKPATLRDWTNLISYLDGFWLA